MTTRRALTLTSLKGEDNLEIRHVPIPDVGDNDVLINVKFCGLNFAECSLRQGLYSPIPPLPTVPGYECSGVIGQIGSQVTDLKVGDRVVGLKNFGAWSDVVVLPSSDCNVIPDNMSLEDAAAIPVNYLTSYLMLFDQAALKPGDKVFVHMAAGGVGTAVGQLCLTVPDVTVIGTASKAKHKHCLANGIHHPIDYKSLDFVEETRKLFPKGVDIMLDPVGGPTSKKSHTLLRSLGKHIHYGGSSYISGANKTWTSMFSIMWNFFNSGSYSGFGLMERSVLVGGLHVGKMMQDPEYHPVTRRAMTNLLNMYKEEKIKPHIDSVWHFEQIKEAMGRIYSGQNVGKVILNASVMSDKGTQATKK